MIKKIFIFILAMSVMMASLSYVASAKSKMSKVKLSKKSITLYEAPNYTYAVAKIKVLNASSQKDYLFEYGCTNDELYVDCELKNSNKTILITTHNIGKGTLSLYLDGKEFAVKINVKKLKFNKDSIVMAKGSKNKIKIVSGPKKAKWHYTKKKIVTVSKKGVVKAKKVGNTIAYIKTSGGYAGCAISVVSKKLYKVIKEARRIAKGTYDSDRRMQDKFYDEASLIWRAYAKQKMFLVNKKTAPNLDELYEYYSARTNKQIKGGLTETNTKKMKFRPGDLYFNNPNDNMDIGSSTNVIVDGVEMFAGYEVNSMSSPKDYLVLPKWITKEDDYGFKGMVIRP